MLTRTLRTMGLAIAVLGAAAGGARAQLDQLTVPDKEVLTILVRTTMIAFNHANLTGNYSVLRDLGAPGFTSANTAADLALIFRGWREEDLDIGPIVLFEPVYTEGPEITNRGMLHFEGYFPTRPLRVKFGMLFEHTDGRWRLFGMNATWEDAPPAQAAQPAAPAEQAAPQDASDEQGGASP